MALVMCTILLTLSGGINAHAATYTMNTGGQWLQQNGRWWYYHTDGSYTTNNWEMINNKWYYFDSQGYMHTGWLMHNNNWYYLSKNGDMQTGWQLINGKYYYFATSGEMQTGWVFTDGTWYYCSEASGSSEGQWIDNTGTRMIQQALKYVGYPYVYGGNSLTGGIDCSGFVKQISATCGISMPRTSIAQYNQSTKILKLSLQPGELLFYNNPSIHIAFYVGKITYNGKTYTNAIVHVANSKDGICVQALYGSPKYATHWR